MLYIVDLPAPADVGTEAISLVWRIVFIISGARYTLGYSKTNHRMLILRTRSLRQAPITAMQLLLNFMQNISVELPSYVIFFHNMDN